MLEEIVLMRKTLRLVKLFEGFCEEDARDFLHWSKRCDVDPGQRVIAEGEPGQDLFIVAAGLLRVVKSRGGLEQELALLRPGDSFGEVALVDSGGRSASVIAVTPSTLLRFERKYLVKVPQVSLKLYRNLAAMMAARLRDTSARVVLSRHAESPANPARTSRPG
jgi:CRP-like cAMP-binding protein